MLFLLRIALTSAWLLTVGVSLAWGQGQRLSSSNSGGPSASQPQPSQQFFTVPPPPPAGQEPPTYDEAVAEGESSSSRGGASVVTPITLKDVSVDSYGIVRIGRIDSFGHKIEAHPHGRYVRVHDVEVSFVNEGTPPPPSASGDKKAATTAGVVGYEVRTPNLEVKADGRVVQHKKIFEGQGNPTKTTASSIAGGMGSIEVVGVGKVRNNTSSGFKVGIDGNGSIYYHQNSNNNNNNDDAGASNTATGEEDFEAAFSNDGSVEYRVGGGGGSYIKMKPTYAGSFVSPARHLATYLSNDGSFEWDAHGKISINPLYAGELAYGGGHHGFGAFLSNGGESSYAANDGGVFSIRPTDVGSMVSGPHSFGAHLTNGGKVKHESGKESHPIPNAGGDTFSINATDAGVVASGRHAFGASLSNGGEVKYHASVSFFIKSIDAGTVVSGMNGFAAYFDDGGDATYEMADNSFELSAICAGEVYSQRLHHFSAKLSDGGSIKHGAELGDFSVEAMADGEVTYGGGGAMEGEKSEKKKNVVVLRVQLTRLGKWQPVRKVENVEMFGHYSQTVTITSLNTGSITHDPKTGFVVQVNGPSTVTLSDAVTGEQQRVFSFKGAGTVSFDSSAGGIKTTGEVGEEE